MAPSEISVGVAPSLDSLESTHRTLVWLAGEALGHGGDGVVRSFLLLAVLDLTCGLTTAAALALFELLHRRRTD